MTLGETNELLRRALARATSSPHDALALLDDGIERATASDAAKLARHAAVVALGTGDAPRAVAYLRRAIAAEPADAYLHLAIGEALEAAGDLEAARRAFDDAARLGTSQGDADVALMASRALRRLDQGDGR